MKGNFDESGDWGNCVFNCCPPNISMNSLFSSLLRVVGQPQRVVPYEEFIRQVEAIARRRSLKTCEEDKSEESQRIEESEKKEKREYHGLLALIHRFQGGLSGDTSSCHPLEEDGPRLVKLLDGMKERGCQFSLMSDEEVARTVDFLREG